MQVSGSMAVFLAWLCVVAFSADLYATTMLPGAPVAAGQSRDDSQADPEQVVSIWDQRATWVWSNHHEFHLALTGELRELRGKDGVGWALVLILAAVMDLIWHGALAVLAMSVGTAITIVVLAILATKAREWAGAVVAHRSPLWALAAGGVGALGGALLLLLGLWLLNASFALKPTMGL